MNLAPQVQDQLENSYREWPKSYENRMEALGHLTTAYERARASIGRSRNSLDYDRIRETLIILAATSLRALDDLFGIAESPD